MPRLASLFLPDLAIDRIRRSAPPERPASLVRSHGGGANDRILASPGGGWRPGARWAREGQAEDFRIRAGGGALVTMEKRGNQNVIAAVCPAGRALGLHPGMPLTKARILVRDLDVRPADGEGDAAFLARLGLFAARRWTPRAAVSGPDGLWLDLSGVAHLFGGEQAMCERILAFSRRLGLAARIAVAGTAGAAHALARFGGRNLILCPTHGEAEAIAAMPLAALRLDADALKIADRLGLEWIGELIAMPRAPLQRRFGSALLGRLDQALGRAGEPFDPIVPEEPPCVTLRFLEPIASAEAIGEACSEAVRRLVPQLAEAGLGLRRLALVCERVDREEQRVAVSLARATRDGAHLLRLLTARIETIEPGFGIERLHLVATRVEPLGAIPIEGELTGERSAPDLAVLIDRLAVRLGTRRLHRLSALESDLPERSVGRAPLLGGGADWPKWPRPVRLLTPPEPVEQVLAVLPDGAPMRFKWRGRAYRVAAADGPERLYGEWWRRDDEREAVRDYFQVEDEEGGRFWLFRKGDGEQPGTGDQSWHVHGLFG
jgi:protein ImuB